MDEYLANSDAYNYNNDDTCNNNNTNVESTNEYTDTKDKDYKYLLNNTHSNTCGSIPM